MNALGELDALLALFPEGEPLIARAEHIPSATTPEPYHRLLVHNSHMTVTMEEFHQSPVEVKVLAVKQEGDAYCRKILLLKAGTDQVVQFGIVRFNLSYVSPEVRAEILAQKTPLGRVLINHDVLRHIDLAAVLRILPGPQLATHFGTDEPTYGRLATIFCNGQPAIDLLEISVPV